MRCCSSCRCVGSACSRRPSMSSVCLLPTALAVLTSVHHPRACARAGTQVWAWQSMRGHAWACARTKKVVRCDRSALATQVEHAHGYVVWAHHHLCAFDQLEYRVSSEPSSGRATRLVSDSIRPGISKIEMGHFWCVVMFLEVPRARRLNFGQLGVLLPRESFWSGARLGEVDCNAF